MITHGIFRSKVVAMAALAAFVLLLAPAQGLSQTAPASRTGTLSGTVYGTDKKPVPNATVRIRNLNTQKEYSAPTNPKGQYTIPGIEEGWYTVGVSSTQGDFNLTYGVYIKGGETARLSVSMKLGGALEGKGAGGGGRSFFKSPVGILTIVALAGGAGFGIYELTKSEASPDH